MSGVSMSSCSGRLRPEGGRELAGDRAARGVALLGGGGDAGKVHAGPPARVERNRFEPVALASTPPAGRIQPPVRPAPAQARASAAGSSQRLPAFAVPPRPPT